MKIQWYPGHMTKARRAMETDVKAVDLIIELVDARAPMATRNPDVESLGKGKYRIILLNKADLAEDPVSYDWVRYFKAQGCDCFFMDGRSRQNLKRLLVLIERVCEEKRQRDKKRGILNRPLRAMVAGIPNVGKSTLINTIAGKATAKTGNKPGVTRGNQWIRLNKTVELLDTPGILWPKFEDEHIGTMIAFLGSINEMIVDVSEMASELFGYLIKNGKADGMLERFSITPDMKPAEMLEKIAIDRGCLKNGAEPDLEKAAAIVMNEFRAGKLGRISLEKPPVEIKAEPKKSSGKKPAEAGNGKTEETVKEEAAE